MIFTKLLGHHKFTTSTQRERTTLSHFRTYLWIRWLWSWISRLWLWVTRSLWIARGLGVSATIRIHVDLKYNNNTFDRMFLVTIITIHCVCRKPNC